MTEHDQRALLEECLTLNGELRLPSVGTSMWPDIRSGDELRLARVEFAAVSPGDIVLFHHESPAVAGRPAGTTLVAHRVLKTYVESGRAMLILKGDNRTFADPPIFYEQVVGRVEEASRDGKVVYRRGGYVRDRWLAWRSLAQERVWHALLDRTLGATVVSLETQAVCQILAYALDWVAIPQIAATVDWEEIYELGRAGRLTPVLGHKPVPGAPAWFQERCRRDLRENQAQQMLLYQQLGAMLQAFEARGIKVMLVKGPAHAELVFPNPSWRPMVDIDLVVRPDDWQASLATLRELGFAPEESDWSGLTEELTGQVAMLKPMGPAIAAVELHRDLRMLSERLAVRGEVQPERAWADAKPFEVAGARCLTLAPEDAIAYASTHWAQHHFFMSIWLLDIALMASRPDLKWDKLVRQAHADGTAHFLWAALFLGQSLFSAPVPPEVLTALQPPWAKGVAIRHLVWEKALSTFHERADARSLLLQVLLFKRWRWTLASLVAGVFPSRTWLAQHYGAHEARRSTLALLARHWRNLGRLVRGA